MRPQGKAVAPRARIRRGNKSRPSIGHVTGIYSSFDERGKVKCLQHRVLTYQMMSPMQRATFESMAGQQRNPVVQLQKQMKLHLITFDHIKIRRCWIKGGAEAWRDEAWKTIWQRKWKARTNHLCHSQLFKHTHLSWCFHAHHIQYR